MTRILIVDDKAENLYLLRVMLERHGFAVDEARNGAEALENARQLAPDLVISDLLMPVMDGYTLLREWKTDEMLRGVPFIVYTATYTESKDEKLALDIGADAFIIKPAEYEPFMRRVHEVLDTAARGKFPLRAQVVGEEAALREYSEVIFAKLEKRNAQLEARIAEHTRAEEALREYAEKLRRLSHRLFETEEIERRRLARELHDRIGQNLTILNMTVGMIRAALAADAKEQVCAHLGDCESLLQATGDLMRDVMADLRPPALDELGLLAALSGYARETGSRGKVPIAISGAEIAPRLPPTAEIALFRIAQEAIVNVLKHARATGILLTLESCPDAVRLAIADNGCGFDLAVQRSQATAHVGLVHMRERAESIGGQLRVESAPGSGTRVLVEVPRAAPNSSNQVHLPGLESVRMPEGATRILRASHDPL